ncbi:nucleotidyltransferase domain-containing protein [Candidatus Saganbacteria bacterium]|nr:nucleotidyltransferase domain-containing protein [Candidatus Saganbacteria bacterium]
MSCEIKDQEIKSFLEQNLAAIKRGFNPQELWFFGSRALGKARPNSDIDMILVSNKFLGRKFIYRMGDFLKTIDFHRHIDAICYTPDEFKEKKNEIGIVSEALEKGMKII